MPDITVDPTKVIRKKGSYTSSVAGAPITAGQAVALVGGKVVLASAASADTVKAVGIALNSAAAAGQPVTVLGSGGQVEIADAGMTPGMAYYVSVTAGGICTRADLAAGNSVCLIGLADSATLLNIDAQYSSAIIP